MWKPLAGLSGRSQWCDASASQRREAEREACAELFGSVDCIIGTKGQEERVRTATKESGEAVSEGNVAEKMTVPRKAIGKSARLQSHGCDNV